MAGVLSSLFSPNEAMEFMRFARPAHQAGHFLVIPTSPLSGVAVQI